MRVASVRVRIYKHIDVYVCTFTVFVGISVCICDYGLYNFLGSKLWKRDTFIHKHTQNTQRNEGSAKNILIAFSIRMRTLDFTK